MIISKRFIASTIGIVAILLCFILIQTQITSCKNKKENNKKDTVAVQNPYAESEITLKTFQNKDTTWGYDIYIDGNIYVHQPHKPALPGTNGFNNEKSAQKAAETVVSKIRKNILPPTLSVGEVDSIIKITIGNKDE